MPKVEANISNARMHPNLQMSDRLAYILGVIEGDGWLNKNSGSYRVGLRVADKLFSDNFAEHLRGIGLNPSTYCVKMENPRHRDQYVVEACSKVFYQWYMDLSLSSITELISQDVGFVRAFLQGFYESEGGVAHRTKNNWRVTIYNSDHALIKFVQAMIEQSGFSTSMGSHKRDGKKREYRLCILKGGIPTLRFLDWINPVIKQAEGR